MEGETDAASELSHQRKGSIWTFVWTFLWRLRGKGRLEIWGDGGE